LLVNKDLELIIRLNDLETILKELIEGGHAAEELLGFPVAKREKIAQARDELRAQASRRILSKFDTVFARYGKAVAPVLDGVAYCCYEKLPINLSATAAKNQELISCPYCGRFLYFLA
jgi:predicted  nucleic acid-binding Zn-ribbon protein